MGVTHHDGIGITDHSTITQSSSKATGVTIHAESGLITTDNASMNGPSEVDFIVTNSKVLAGDVIVVGIRSGATDPADYQITVTAVAAGSFTIALANLGSSSRTDVLLLNFVIIHGGAAPGA